MKKLATVSATLLLGLLTIGCATGSEDQDYITPGGPADAGIHRTPDARPHADARPRPDARPYTPAADSGLPFPGGGGGGFPGGDGGLPFPGGGGGGFPGGDGGLPFPGGGGGGLPGIGTPCDSDSDCTKAGECCLMLGGSSGTCTAGMSLPGFGCIPSF